MKDILTVEEFLKKENLPVDILSGDDISYAMIEFAKHHVQEALEEAKKIADDFEGHQEMNEAILKAYPLENIK